MSDLFSENLDIAKSQAKFYAGTHGESYESLLGIAMQELWRLATERGDRPGDTSFSGYARKHIRGAILRYLKQLSKDTTSNRFSFVSFDGFEKHDLASEYAPEEDSAVVWQLVDEHPDPESELSDREESSVNDNLLDGIQGSDRFVVDLVMSGASMAEISRETGVNRRYVRKFVQDVIVRAGEHVNG